MVSVDFPFSNTRPVWAMKPLAILCFLTNGWRKKWCSWTDRLTGVNWMFICAVTFGYVKTWNFDLKRNDARMQDREAMRILLHIFRIFEFLELCHFVLLDFSAFGVWEFFNLRILSRISLEKETIGSQFYKLIC